VPPETPAAKHWLSCSEVRNTKRTALDAYYRRDCDQSVVFKPVDPFQLSKLTDSIIILIRASITQRLLRKFGYDCILIYQYNLFKFISQ
jgi:hypothetical protein